MRRFCAPTAATLLVLLAVGLVGCGAQAPTSSGGSAGAGTTRSATGTPAPPCPDTPPGGALPSPLPALNDALPLPTSPCSARYEGVADARGLKSFTLTIGRVAPGVPYFAPTVLKGTPDEVLTLRVINTTPGLHNISIPEQGINVDVAAGAAVDVAVTFPTRGPAVYFCSYHTDEDQAGELFTVSP